MSNESPVPLDLVTTIVSAYVGNNIVPAADLGALIASVHGALAGIGEAPAPVEAEPLKPAVPIRKSVTPDYIICLEDGKKLKMLRRHLHTAYGMTPDAYRAKWNLPSDYPMVAPNYAQQRSALAKSIGLGQRTAPIPEPEPEPVKAPRRKRAAKAE